MKNKTLMTLILMLLLSQSVLATVQSSALPQRPFLGVAGSTPVTGGIKGALINRVIPGGTGDTLKLQTDDLITSLNNIEINNFNQLIDS